MHNSAFKILIVDDEKKICEILEEILDNEGYTARSANNGVDAIKQLDSQDFNLVLLDIKLPDIDGITILKTVKNRIPYTAVVMISAFGTVSLAVEALKNGADDFIEKPLETNRVLTTVRNILEKYQLQKESDTYRAEISSKYRVIGNSPSIMEVLKLMDKIAASNKTVLVIGESGVGKELVARGIHMKSRRAALPFVKVNCAALPGELIESELFGFEKGAFTGAHARKMGQFEAANQGTLLLDEIGDMSLQAQAKVLRAIEDNEILRLGSTKPIRIDVRIIAATNQDLQQLIKQKMFRDDLYHRINVLSINVPPLREHKEDIPELANYFLRESCIENNKPLKQVTSKTLDLLMSQSWPGNVRELKHIMERISILTDKQIINTEDIYPITGMNIGMVKMNPNRNPGDTEITSAKNEFEKEHIAAVLEKTGWRVGRAAKILGIDRSTLFRKMKKLGIKM